jgi:hypothetical protein
MVRRDTLFSWLRRDEQITQEIGKPEQGEDALRHTSAFESLRPP